MTEEFTVKLEQKKKEVDEYIARAEKPSTKQIFTALRSELENIGNLSDLESKIASARNFKNHAKKDATRTAFDVIEKELTNLKSSIESAGMPAPETKKPEARPAATMEKPKASKSRPSTKHAKTPARTHARPLSDIHRMTGRRRAPAHVKAADKNIALMQKFRVKVPELRLSLEDLQKRNPEHAKSVQEIKMREKEIHRTVKDVSDSIEKLKSHVTEKVTSEKLRSRLNEQEMLMKQKEAEHIIEKSTEKLNMKVEMMSRSLDEALESLSRRIDESSKIGKLEMSGNIEYLKNQIEELRSELPEFAKKKDIEKVIAQKAPKKRRIKKHRHARKKRPKPAEKTPPKEEAPTVSISELKNHKDDTVVVEADVTPGSKVEEGEVTMYGYRLSDGTGEVMMTSLRELPPGRGRMLCEVNESLGKIFLRFLKPA